MPTIKTGSMRQYANHLSSHKLHLQFLQVKQECALKPWGYCNQEHVIGDSVLTVLWLLRRTSGMCLEKIPYLSWQEFLLYTVLWAICSCMCNSNDVSHGQERKREMEAGPECEMWKRNGVESQLLAPRKWLEPQTSEVLISRSSDVLDGGPSI